MFTDIYHVIERYYINTDPKEEEGNDWAELRTSPDGVPHNIKARGTNEYEAEDNLLKKLKEYGMSVNKEDYQIYDR